MNRASIIKRLEVLENQIDYRNMGEIPMYLQGSSDAVNQMAADAVGIGAIELRIVESTPNPEAEARQVQALKQKLEALEANHAIHT